MKISTHNNKTVITISQADWAHVGNKAGWLIEAGIKFLRGADYPDLCTRCKKTLNAIADQFEDGLMPDTDDNEAPAMFMYDNSLYCGGHQCDNHVV